MPVEDLIRYFNTADAAGDSTLYVAGERVEAWHGGLHLGSLFQPIVDLRAERVVGHQASLVYEAILKRCGLGPSDIVLDIDPGDVDLDSHSTQALANYRQRGYRLALPAVLALQPDILRLLAPDPAICATARSAGIQVEINRIDDGATFRAARDSGGDLGQGRLFGEPSTACRPTHSRSRNPYNSLSSFGARP